jgi:sugar lactone lactonase YvrE
MPNGVLRVNDDGSTELIANLSAFVMAFPVAHPEPDDFEPDGTWYSMIAVGGNLYAVEPNHGELDRITPDGQISRVTDISASQGHIVPTAIAHRGNFYVGNLNTFPIVPGSSKVYKITPSGNVSVFAEGLTTILGVVFDRRDRMYVLETSTAAGDPTPFTGKVIRVDPSRRQTEIASGLFFPTGMTLGPDGALYVSNVGFGPPPAGLGEILRITVP